MSSFKDRHYQKTVRQHDKHGKGSNLLGMGKQSQQAKKVSLFVNIITIFRLVKQPSSGAMITFLFSYIKTTDSDVDTFL